MSVSRGKEKATLYVEDKQAMRHAITRSSERQSATELVKGTVHEYRREEWMYMQRAVRYVKQRAEEWRDRLQEKRLAYGR